MWRNTMIKQDTLLDFNDYQHPILSFTPPIPYQAIAAQFISQAHFGIILLDDRKKVIEVNSAACSYLGIDTHSLLYRHVEELTRFISLKKSDCHRLDLFLQSPWDKQKIEVQLRTKRRSYHFIFSSYTVEDLDNRFKGYYLMIEDITEIKSLKQQATRNNRLATLGQIAAGTAHEIRNPLTSIQGFLQVIGHSLIESGQQKEQGYIDIMLKEISRINTMVGEFLLLSKPHSIHLKTVDVMQVLGEILPIIENEAILYNIDIEIDHHIPSQPIVVADEEMLKQVFLNLCKNAIEAMNHEGVVTIRLFLEATEHNLVIEVIDKGPGISSRVLKRIFEPFFTTKENGTGLGLPICQQIMREIGGHLKISSTKGNGTIVQVVLPMA
jgi:PAS domain S-box-containing protein